jgi:exopolyphosphatase/guanosine-5'-triphosphate,3'-diphosphate pyrophosphatase
MSGERLESALCVASLSVVQRSQLSAVYRFAESVSYEAAHARHVAELAVTLFDSLAEIHGLDQDERFLLYCAGILHDIGWIEGQEKHHKRAMKMILDAPHLPLSQREKLIVASVARYHRKAEPSRSHTHFAALAVGDRRIVRRLAALIRVADGLDRSHAKIVKTIRCEVRPEAIVIRCGTTTSGEVECQTALKKGTLLERIARRKLVIRWDTV